MDSLASLPNFPHRIMNETSSRFLIGIDLGTSNSAVFYIDQDELTQKIQQFLIPQWIEGGQLHDMPSLPSSIYLLTREEINSKQFQLPWESSSQSHVVGEWARAQQSQRPGRNVTSVKSWLCYHSLDPHTKVLPHSEITDLPHYSPVEATTIYLNHIKEAWNYKFAGENQELRFESQNIVITVPASFDEAAREYTVEAIELAGIRNFTLLEEPQAAFYSWIASTPEKKLDNISEDRTILVIDIGGGTTDFSLVRMTFQGEDHKPSFERIAVSDHLLLGGDNIDLTLATHVERQITNGKRKLAVSAWESLISQCRHAKKLLLSGQTSKHSITVAEPGSRLIGRTRTVELALETIQDIILEGFFPLIAWDSPSPQTRQHGLREFGLPYASEPAITRHLCSFIKRYIQEHEYSAVFPDHILFNGGTLAPSMLRERLQEQLEQWRKEAAQSQYMVKDYPVRVMDAENMHLAVARGATYYHLARQGKGLHITGGSARSYYINLMLHHEETDTVEEAWLCIVPQQADIETPLPISDVDFWLSINQPIQFKLISSIHRPNDQVGNVFQFTDKQLEDSFITLPPIQTFISIDRKTITKKTKEIPVRLRARLNEIGTLSVFCVSLEKNEEWKLEFFIRGNVQQDESSQLQPIPTSQERELPSEWEDAEELIRQRYGKRSRSQPKEEGRPFSLYKQLEQALGYSRQEWEVFLLRALWDALFEGVTYRVRSLHHELNWIKLSGFCLRPGFGHTGDEWRIQHLSDILLDGPVNKERGVEIEWWIMFRRIAGGLSGQIQNQLLNMIHKRLAEGTSKRKPGLSKKKGSKQKGGKSQSSHSSLNELWRLAASLEDIPASEKIQLGNRLIKQIKSKEISGFEGWCLARFGARVPLYGNPVNVINATTVESWIEWLLTLKNTPFQNELPLILTRLGQTTGDRNRDIQPAIREKILNFLKGLNDTEELQKMLIATPTTHQKDEIADSSINEWLFGDALPTGLKMVYNIDKG